jgi:nitrite reductase/ring-hydroxylating ferredoxin subunit
MPDLSRRQFVAACACAACATCPALRALAEAEAAKAGPINVGPLADFRERGIHDPSGPGRRFFLVNRGGRLYAVSSTCTHKRVGLVAKNGAFRCPRHGSVFGADGNVTKAPARKPLPRYAIHVDEHARLIVDPSAVFEKGAWDDPASFVRLD